MRLYEAIEENSKLDSLHKILHGLFIEYDNAIIDYQNYFKYYSKNSSEDIDNIIDTVDNKEEVKDKLKNIISVLNKMQTIFEKVGYTSNTSSPEDVNEDNFSNQLDNFSGQCLALDSDFTRESFTAFFNQLSYMTTLTELHYNNLFGELKENIIVSENAEDALEETEEYLEGLPEIKTNEVK